MAPHGSSTLITRSLKSTPPQTVIPAKSPITIDQFALTNAQGAVIATNPASMPLQAMETSGFPNLRYQMTRAAAEPAQAARLVLTAMAAMRRSVAPSVDPGLK